MAHQLEAGRADRQPSQACAQKQQQQCAGGGVVSEPQGALGGRQGGLGLALGSVKGCT